MGHVNISNSWNESYDENNTSFWFDDFNPFCIAHGCYFSEEASFMYVFALVIICISLLLILVAIYSLSSLVRKDHGAPVYVINLLISDIIQLLCMIGLVAEKIKSWTWIFIYLYRYGLLSSIGFMVCISLERYLFIAWPLWYRFRRTIKTSVVVSVLVWILPLVLILIALLQIPLQVMSTIFSVYLLLPLPLFIFFLGGTLKALSASLSVSSDEKRRIVSVLVVVLLIYTLMFLPTVIWLLVGEDRKSFRFIIVSDILLLLSPLADLILYIFIKKGTTDKLLASLCCCRMQLQESPDKQQE